MNKLKKYIFACFICVVFLIPAHSVLAATKGVFVGTSNYTQPGCSPLPDTRFDANDMRNTLIKKGVVAGSGARLMTGQNTKSQILDGIRQQGQGLGPDDTLIIYNSGHGSSSGKMCASDADITPAEMADAIRASGAGNVIIINDSCHSERFQVNVPGKNVSHINAAAGDKVGWSSKGNTEGMGHKNGALTRRLIEGLETGKADYNGDGKMTSKELAGYAALGVKMDEPDTPTHDYDNNSKKQKPNHKGADIPVTTGKEKKPDKEAVETLMTMVPGVIGQTEDTALASLSADDLEGSVESYAGDKVKGFARSAWVGKVIECHPREGTRVEKHSSVTLFVPQEEDLVEVPGVLGLKASDAAKAILAAGLKHNLLNREHAVNNISHQEPTAGTKVIRGSVVTIAKGDANKVSVPFVMKKTKDQADEMVKAQKLQPSIAVAKPADYNTHQPFTYKGLVWDCNPAPGTWTNINSVVNISVAPDDPVDVPNIMGKTEDEAREAITGAGLVFSVSLEAMSAAAPRGVFYFRPKPQAFKGDTIQARIEYPEVPDVKGKNAADAGTACAAAKLKFTSAKKIIKDAATGPDVIADQAPAAGQKAKWGDSVTGYFPEDKTKVPGLVGLDRQAAESRLAAAGLNGDFTEEKPSPGQYAAHPPVDIEGKAWKQSPGADTEVNVNSNVSVSMGPEGAVRVPNMMNMTDKDAKGALSGAGLLMSIGSSSASAFAPRGVTSWTPNDYAYKGDTVSVDIEFPEVPDVVGEDSVSASNIIMCASLFAKIQERQSETDEPGTVISQSPSAGTRAKFDSSVTCIVAKAPEKKDDEDKDEDEEKETTTDDKKDETPPEEPVKEVYGPPLPPGWSPFGSGVAGPAKADGGKLPEIDMPKPKPESQTSGSGPAPPAAPQGHEHDENPLDLIPKLPVYTEPASSKPPSSGSSPASSGGSSGTCDGQGSCKK